MQSLTNEIVTGYIDALIDEMTIVEAITYITHKWGEMMEFVIENDDIPMPEKDLIIAEIVESLKDYGVNDISYIQNKY